MSSGSSATDIKKPTNDRIILVNLCHIDSSYSRPLRLFGHGWTSLHGPSCDRVFAHEISDRVSDLFFFLLLFQAPPRKALLLTSNLVVIGLDFCSLLGQILINLRLNLRILLAFLRLQFFHRTLLHALVRIKSAVTSNSVLDDVFDIGSRCVQGNENRRFLDVGWKTADMLAFEHMGHLENRIPLRCRWDFGRLVDFIKGSR